jgi:hypothetical protein
MIGSHTQADIGLEELNRSQAAHTRAVRSDRIHAQLSHD